MRTSLRTHLSHLAYKYKLFLPVSLKPSIFSSLHNHHSGHFSSTFKDSSHSTDNSKTILLHLPTMGVKSLMMLAMVAVASASPEMTKRPEMAPLGTTFVTMASPPAAATTHKAELEPRGPTLSVDPTMRPSDPPPSTELPPGHVTGTRALVEFSYRSRYKSRWFIYDADKPMAEYTCQREALAALANWRMFCDKPIKDVLCWTRAPSIDRCCSKWVSKTDAKYKDNPTLGKYWDKKTNTWLPEVDEKKHPGQRQIVMTKKDEFLRGDDVCREWRTENDPQFRYLTQFFVLYGVNETEQYKKLLPATKV